MRVERTSTHAMPAEPRENLAPRMVKNFKKLPPELQKVARSAFSKFDPSVVRSLREQGLSIRFVRSELDEAGGRYNAGNKTIELYVDPSDPHAETYLIHEMVHSVDRLRFKEEHGVVDRVFTPSSDRFASRQDPELGKLHAEYAKRTLPGVGRKVAEHVREHPEMLGHTLNAGGRKYGWELNGETLDLKEKERSVRYLEAVSPSLGAGVVSSVIGAAALTVGVAAGATLVGGLIAAPLVLFGAKHLIGAAHAFSDERALDGFTGSGVKVTGGDMSFNLNQPVTEASEPTSVYATLSRRPEEYLAESMAEYLRSPETRESLRRRDPEMFRYCEAWKLAP